MPDEPGPVLTSSVPWGAAALHRAHALLQRGEVVALPTETVYGLAADATNAAGVARIFEAKGRPLHNPLIVHVGETMTSVTALEADGLVRRESVTPAMRSTADALIAGCWPGPLTIILPRGPRLPDIVSGGLPSSGFRMPAHAVMLELLRHTGFPLAAPSANRSNRVSPTTAAHVMTELEGRIPLIVDGGAASIGVESTIVRIDDSGGVQLLRPGGMPIEQVERLINRSALPAPAPGGAILTSGMMKEHYAPQTPLLLVHDDATHDLSRRIRAVAARPSVARVGVLRMEGAPEAPSVWALGDAAVVAMVVALDDGDHGDNRNDGERAARGLFAALRSLDDGRLDLILAQVPGSSRRGFWPAIADRLQRAGARWNVPRYH
jgi:L-threonylcarbamoyladenylate synthase